MAVLERAPLHWGMNSVKINAILLQYGLKAVWQLPKGMSEWGIIQEWISL